MTTSTPAYAPTPPSSPATSLDEVLATLDEIDAYVAENRYARHSFVGAVEAGDFTDDTLRAWAVQKYFQTREQNCVHGAVHFNSRRYIEVRKYQVEQLIDEETPDGEGSAPHYELIKRLAVALGATEPDFDDANMGAPVDRFVSYLLNVCITQPPALGMLGSYINERQTPESAGRMFRALERQTGFDDATLEWFSCHAEADVAHADTGRELITRTAVDVPDFRARALAQVAQGIDEWRALHDFYFATLTEGAPVHAVR